MPSVTFKNSANYDKEVVLYGGYKKVVVPANGSLTIEVEDIVVAKAEDAIEHYKAVLNDVITVTTIAENPFETEDGQAFSKVEDAIKHVAESGGTVTLVSDAEPSGLKVESGKNFTIDLGGHKMYMKDPMTGSVGTETNGFQFLKGSTIVIKNGIIESDIAKILVQNYSNLTLDNVRLVGSPSNTYVLSNNFGNVVLKNGTEITATGENVAFDVYYGMSKAYDDGVTVTIEDPSVVINGKIEYARASRTKEEDFLSKANIFIPKGYSLEAPEGYKWVDSENNMMKLAKIGTPVVPETETPTENTPETNS